MICGTQLIGDIDFTDTTFISTEFFHLFYIPLLPLRSLRVKRSSVRGMCNRSYEGVEIPFSCKSILWGYFQRFLKLSFFPLFVLSTYKISDTVNNSSDSASKEYLINTIAGWGILPVVPIVVSIILSILIRNYCIVKKERLLQNEIAPEREEGSSNV